MTRWSVKRAGFILITGFIVLILLSGAASSQLATVEKNGLVYPYPQDEVYLPIEDVNSLVSDAGLEVRTNYGMLSTDSNDYYVVSGRDIPVSNAEVVATLIPTNPTAPDILYLDDEQTTYSANLRQVGIFELKTRSFSPQLVTNDSTVVHEITWEIESNSGPSYQLALLNIGISVPKIHSLRALKSRMIQHGKENSRALPVFASGLRSKPIIVSTGFNRESWWVWGLGGATMGFVNQTEVGPLLQTRSVSMDSKNIENSRAAVTASKGEVVTVEARVMASKISVRDVLIKASSCPPDMIGQGGTCVPAISDVTLHAGALSNKDDLLVPIMGLNNEKIDRSIELYTGRYRVTGAILNASRVDPRLKHSTVLQVYDMKRLGATDPSTELVSTAGSIRRKLEGQLTMNKSEWQMASDVAESDDSRPDSSNSTQTSAEETANVKQRHSETPKESPRVERGVNTTTGGDGNGFTPILAILALVLFSSIERF